MKIQPSSDRDPRQADRGEGTEARATIIIPDTAKEKPMEGKVIAVGAGAVNKEGKRIPLEVKVGDRVLFGKYAGTEIKIDDHGARHPSRGRGPRHHRADPIQIPFWRTEELCLRRTSRTPRTPARRCCAA